ncbi:MAG: DUF4145 domain-containing protein [Pseudomonadota bacterium]
MNDPKYVAPKVDGTAFNCPICGAYAQMRWTGVRFFEVMGHHEDTRHKVSKCAHCHGYALWAEHRVRGATGAWVVGHHLVHPPRLTAPAAAQDLPEACKADFEEARRVVGVSPRSAAALLRLCVQRLCMELGLPGKNLNADVGELVKRGLRPEIQKALDVVRIVGNNAVHPGTLDLDDNPEIAQRLFVLVNVIVEAMITLPKQIQALYAAMPADAVAAVEKRDGQVKPAQ